MSRKERPQGSCHLPPFNPLGMYKLDLGVWLATDLGKKVMAQNLVN